MIPEASRRSLLHSAVCAEDMASEQAAIPMAAERIAMRHAYAHHFFDDPSDIYMLLTGRAQ